MDRKQFYICFLFAFLFLHHSVSDPVFAVNAVQEIQSEHVLSIRVLDRGAQPVSGAIVFVDDENEKFSDASGWISYSLPSGTYHIQIYAADYLDYTGRVQISDTDKTLEAYMDTARFWSTSPAKPPIGVGETNGVRIAVADDKLYYWVAFGGEAGTRSYGSSQAFYSYDPLADRWTRLPDAPFGSTYGLTAAYGHTPGGTDAIYILRGFWSGQRTWVARYNLDTGIWEDGLNHQIPWQTDFGSQYSGSGFQDYPRNGAVMVWGEDGFMYLFPGSGYGYEKYDWYRYDVAGNTWEAMPRLPHKQGPGNAAVLVRGEATGAGQDYIYTQFGVTPSGTYTHAEFWRYGMGNEMWEKIADHDYGADDGSMLVWDGGDFIYHAPGAYQEQPWDKGLSQKRKFMRYSISRNAWTEMEQTPYNQWGGWDDAGGMVRIGKNIFALKGGSDVAWAEDGSVSGGGSIPSDDFWNYTIAENDYDLTVIAPEGSGRVEPDIGTYTHPEGNRIRLSAEPAHGWHFDSWRVNGTLYDTETHTYLTINEPVELQAVFNQPTMVKDVSQQHEMRAWYADGRIMIAHVPDTVRMRLFDINGRMLFSYVAAKLPAPGIPVKLPAGIYLLHVQHKEGVASAKILVF